MPRFPYLSFPLWVALVLLLWTLGATASVVFGADQKPLVKNSTTGVIEAIQANNTLSLPANPFNQVFTTAAQSGGTTTTPFLATTTLVLSQNDASRLFNRFIAQSSNTAFNYTNALSLRGVYGSSIHAGTGTLTGMCGGNFDAALSNTGTVSAASSVRAGSVATTAAGTITNAYGVLVASPSIAGGGAITNYYGLNIDNITGAGTINSAITTGTGVIRFRDTTSSTSSITGAMVVGDGSTVASNVGIGGGTVSAGGEVQVRGRFIANVADTLAASSAPSIRSNGSGSGDVVAVGSTWTNTKFDSQGTIWTSRAIGGAIVFNQGSNDRPEISWYRGSRNYPELSIRQHGSADTGGQIYAGAGTGAPTLVANILTTGITVPTTTASTTKDNGSIVTEGGIGSEGNINSGGNIAVTVAGGGFLIKEGTNAKMGAATLVAGTVTVNTTAVTANSRIYLTSQADGGTVGFQRISARSAGTSFTITSSNVLDTSTVAWMIVEPAP